MQGRKVSAFAVMLVPCVLLAVATGCKREYPTRALSLPTYSPTISPTAAMTGTFTPTATKTRTSTPSPTQTLQYSPTVTNTFTVTNTPSPTLTPTDTPTPMPPMDIDNFEAGSSAITINSVLGTVDPNTWFTANDGSCSPVFSIVSPYAGNSSAYCGQLASTGCATFGSMGFYFAESITYIYGGTALPISDNSTGVRFDIVKAGGNVSSVRFEYLDDYSTNGIAGNSCGNSCGPGYGKDLIVGSTWTPVTVFWSTATLPDWYVSGGGSHPPDANVMYGMHWIVNSDTKPFNIQVDNVSLIHDPPPPTPTPNCNKIDDMETGKNRGALYVAGDCGSTGSNGHNGFWYTYHDNLGGTCWPASSEVNFMSAPGYNSAYAARLTGTNSTTGGDIYAGMGINLMDPKAFYDLTVGGLYSGVMFDAYVGTATSGIRFKIPDVDTDPDGGICPNISDCTSAKAAETNGCCYDDYGMDMTLSGSWQNYQLSFSSLTQTGFGYIPPGGFKPQQASALQWQFQEPGEDFDLWLDNITLY